MRVPRGLGRWLTAYLVGQAALLVTAAIVPAPARTFLEFAVFLVGAVVLTVAVAVRVPRPRAAWWLIVAATWALLTSAVAVARSYGIHEISAVQAPVPVLISSIPLPILAGGLALLSRTVARSGPVDELDATMVALAAFLLLWTLVLEPRFELTVGSAVINIIWPVGSLLVAGFAIRIVLGRGWRDPATALLLVAVLVQQALTMSNQLPGPVPGGFNTSRASALLWSTFGLVVGAIGLLPALCRARDRPASASTDLTRRRLVLFAVMTLVPLVVWAREDSVGGAGGHRAWAPLLASAVFLALLVVRLGLLARLAQHRAAEQARLREQLAFQARHDPLTGLANRSALTEHLAHGSLAGSALMMIDIDGFKHVNDRYGHQAGDDLLVAVAGRLLGAVPPEAVVARIGGDEFLVLVHGIDSRRASALAQRLVDSLRPTYRTRVHDVSITSSVGVATVPAADVPTYDEALRNADLALYAAKAAGKNKAIVR